MQHLKVLDSETDLSAGIPHHLSQKVQSHCHCSHNHCDCFSLSCCSHSLQVCFGYRNLLEEVRTFNYYKGNWRWSEHLPIVGHWNWHKPQMPCPHVIWTAISAVKVLVAAKQHQLRYHHTTIQQQEQLAPRWHAMEGVDKDRGFFNFFFFSFYTCFRY